MSITSRLKAINLDHRSKESILLVKNSLSSWARKDTYTSRNVDRKNKQPMKALKLVLITDSLRVLSTKIKK